MQRPPVPPIFVAAALACAVWLTPACGGEDKDPAGASESNGGTGPVVVFGGRGGGVSSGAAGPSVSTGGASCSIADDGSGCVGQAYEGESLPVDIYVVFDQSGSMCSCVDPLGGQLCPDPYCKETRLDAIRRAMTGFLGDPASYGLGIGLGYFGQQPIGQANCDSRVYEQPAVGIGVLPEHATEVIASLNSVQPTGETPSGAAIRGACEHARAHRLAHPGRSVVLLLLTDGKPEAPVTCMSSGGACCPTLPDAVAAAQGCLGGDPGIKTYVLGVGPLLGNLDDIAQAGGTERAYLVEGSNVADEVLSALNRIRGDAIPCEFELPPPPDGQSLALNQVNITYADAACVPSYYSYVESPANCSAEGGWYYDDPSAPEKVSLCPASCDEVTSPGGKLLFTVGCATREVPK